MSSANWRIALASAIGTSHESTCSPCQDSAAVTIIDANEGPVLLAAVSDGAGTAAHSDIGSSLSVHTFAELVKSFFNRGQTLADIDQDVARQWVRQTAEQLAWAAELNGHQTRDYSCTLLAAIVGMDQAAFLQVGDGAIVVSHGEDDGWSYVFWPQHGEYANTTNFIQSLNIDEAVVFDLAPRRIDELALFTDGIENLVLQKADRAVYQKFFREMILPVRKATTEGLNADLSSGLQRYLSSPAICERTDDDKTLILATRIIVENQAQ